MRRWLRAPPKATDVPARLRSRRAGGNGCVVQPRDALWRQRDDKLRGAPSGDGPGRLDDRAAHDAGPERGAGSAAAMARSRRGGAFVRTIPP
jgi:hypothetical protein